MVKLNLLIISLVLFCIKHSVVGQCNCVAGFCIYDCLIHGTFRKICTTLKQCRNEKVLFRFCFWKLIQFFYVYCDFLKEESNKTYSTLYLRKSTTTMATPDSVLLDWSDWSENFSIPLELNDLTTQPTANITNNFQIKQNFEEEKPKYFKKLSYYNQNLNQADKNSFNIFLTIQSLLFLFLYKVYDV